MPDQITSTKTRTFKAVDLGVMIFGLIAAGGLAYAVVQMTGEGGGGGGGTTTTTTTSGTGDGETSLVSTFKPQALMLKDLTSGLSAYYFPESQGDVINVIQPGSSMKVMAGTTVLGTFSRGGEINDAVEFTDGQSLPSPKAVTLQFTGDGSDYARFTLGTDAGTMTICVPQSSPPILGPTLYVDTNGNTYQDSKMTKWTMLCSYPEMELISVSAVTTNAPVTLPPNVQGGMVELYAPHFYYQTLWSGTNMLYGFLQATGSWVQTGVDTVAKPLGVYLTEGAEVDADGNIVRYVKLNFPQQTLTLITDRGVKNVCLPAAKSYSKFFIAPNGSTYTDIWLTKLARACS